MLELGITKVGRIIKKSGLVSSAVHNSINSLVDKGLVSYIKMGKIKFYNVVHPKRLVDFIEEKKEKLLEIIPELETKRKISDEYQEAEIFEGIKGITTMLNLLIEDVKKGDEYLFFAINVKEQNEEIQKFFLRYDIKRKEKGLITKGLASEELKRLFVKRRTLKMKYPDFPIPSNISICKNSIVFFSWGEKPVGFLIKSKQIVEIFKDLFRQIWSMR